MAISTYDELKFAVADWTHRGDLTTKLDDFIALAEAEMLSNPLEPLRVRAEEVTEAAKTSTTTRFMALPERFKEMRSIGIILGGRPVDLRYRTPEQLWVRSSTGVPSFFTITSQIEFDCVADAEYDVEMRCLVDLPALTETDDTNAVLSENPNIYLFGCLWAAFQYVQDFESAEANYQKFIAAIQGANLKSKRGSYGPAPVMRIEGATP